MNIIGESELARIPIEPPRSADLLPGLRLSRAVSTRTIGIPLAFIAAMALMPLFVLAGDRTAMLSFRATETISGRVEAAEPGRGCQEGSTEISYSFTSPAGVAFKGRQSVCARSEYERVRAGDSVPVVYVKANPAVKRWPTRVTLASCFSCPFFSSPSSASCSYCPCSGRASSSCARNASSSVRVVWPRVESRLSRSNEIRSGQVGQCLHVARSSSPRAFGLAKSRRSKPFVPTIGCWASSRPAPRSTSVSRGAALYSWRTTSGDARAFCCALASADSGHTS